MSDLRQELANALDQFVKNRITMAIQPATVTAVNESEGTCDVKDVDGHELFDIRLRAAQDEDDNGLTAIPAINSQVLIGNVADSSNTWVVIATTTLQKVIAKVDGATVIIAGGSVAIEKGTSKLMVDASGTLIERASVSLKSTLDALIDQIKLITVTCAAPGFPSTPPVNLAAFDVIKTQLDAILS
jgi:hypothetical protein